MATDVTTGLVYEVFEDREIPDFWIVGAVDHVSEGECYSARFSGFNAEERAREYAAWKQAHAEGSDGGLNAAPAQ